MDALCAPADVAKDRDWYPLFLGAGWSLLVAASVVGTSDNMPGMVLMFAGFFAVFLGVIAFCGNEPNCTRAQQMVWGTPRALSVGLALYFNLLTLNVFDVWDSFWGIMMALLVHLLPTYLVLSILIVAWTREWIGGVFFTLLAVLYAVWVWIEPPALWPVHPIACGVLAMTGFSFLFNWLLRGKLGGEEPQARVAGIPAIFAGLRFGMRRLGLPGS